MKKLIVTFFVLLLVPVLATASTNMVSITELRQQAENMGRWTQTYEAHGRTIEVDIPIIVPEAEKLLIITVVPYLAVEDQRLTRDGTLMEKIGEEGWYSVYEECGLLSYINGEEDYGVGKAEALDLDDYGCAGFLADYLSPLNQENIKTKYTSEFFYPYDRTLSEVYTEDNPVSLKEAVNDLEKVIGYFYPEEPWVYIDRVELRSRLHQVKGIDDYDLGEYVPNYPMGTYVLSIRQMMEGIPIYKDVGEKLSPDLTRKKPELWKRSVRIAGVKNNDFRYMDSHRFGLNSIWLKRQEIQQEDVPIKPLNEILEQLESLIAKGNIRKVHALRFGYCVHFTSESSETYTLYPTWVCECDYAETAKFEFANIKDWISDPRWKYYNKMLMINAQTGNVESLMIETQEEAYVPGIITWEDIQ